LVDVPWTPEATAEKLTLLGFPVDNFIRTGITVSNVIAVKILSFDKHPNADRLKIARVTDGKTEKSIVCGASNIAPNQVVPLAVAGAKLAGNLEIRVSKIRGVESEGMLCSERELGISESHAGIMQLPPETKLGKELKDILGGQDVIFNVDITPNRPDALSHIGLAREIAAHTGKGLKISKRSFKANPQGEPCQIKIEEPKLCFRYIGKNFEGVKVGPSPKWMAERLTSCGIRPINNIVDITNYVLLEWGHPLHAFDLEKLKGREIIVRRAKSGEKILALDEKTYELTTDDLIIADASDPVAIAGVMGGGKTGVTEGTTRLLLESAVFNRVSIRNTSRRLNLSSESSYRFERGTDGWTAEQASLRASVLIMELAGGAPGNAKDAYPKKDKPISIGLRSEKLNLVAGCEVAPPQAEKILKGLSLSPAKKKGGWTCRIPPYRHDLKEEFDLIEEVIRVIGYDHIPETLPRLEATAIPANQKPLETGKLADLLKGLGLNETLTNSFSSPKMTDLLQYNKDELLPLKNPISPEESILRPLISVNLLQAVRRNVHFQRDSVYLFEIGKKYLRSGQAFSEPPSCAFVLYGPPVETSWQTKPRNADFYALKGMVEKISQAIFPDMEIDLSRTVPPFLHPNQSFVISRNGKPAGWGGMLHPSLEAQFDLKHPCAVCEWELGADPTNRHLFKSLPRFPFVERDIAIIVDKNLPWQKIEEEIRKTDTGLLEAAWPFDVFIGGTLEAGKKSVAFRLRLRHAEHTLAEGEINQAVEKIKSNLTTRCGAQLR